MVVVNGGQRVQTSYPATTASWAEGDTQRYIRLVTNGIVTGEDAKNMAEVYCLMSGAWSKADWDDFDVETCDTEMLPFNAEKFKVVFTNGLEWVITKIA